MYQVPVISNTSRTFWKPLRVDVVQPRISTFWPISRLLGADANVKVATPPVHEALVIVVSPLTVPSVVKGIAPVVRTVPALCAVELNGVPVVLKVSVQTPADSPAV